MTLDQFVARLEGVRGRMALCPAHADKNPSLSVHEGKQGILVRCFAGCTIGEICAALNLSIGDLFYNAGGSCLRDRNPYHAKNRTKSWRQSAGKLQDEALGLWLRGTDLLAAARGMDTSQWTDQELEVAMEAVTSAQVDLVLAEIYSNLAFNLRRGGLRKEEEDELRRSRA